MMLQGVENVAKKKRKIKKTAVSDPKPVVPEQNIQPEGAAQAEAPEPSSEPEETEQNINAAEAEEAEKAESSGEAEAEEEFALSEETLAEIGSPDKELVLFKVAKAYEEAKIKREKYKKIGPIFVFVSGVAFLTLIFTLENKISFLILWVVTILFTVALMTRAEYKYHQFRTYLGLTAEEPEDDPSEEEQNAPLSDEQKEEPSQNAEQEEQA